MFAAYYSKHHLFNQKMTAHKMTSGLQYVPET